MEGILLVGKFTDNFREINRCLIGKYEVRSCLRQLNAIEGMLKRKEVALMVMVLEEEESKDELLVLSLKRSCPGVPVIWVESTLSEEEILAKIENALAKAKETPEVKEEKKEEDDLWTKEPEPKAPPVSFRKKVVLMVDDSGVFLRTMKSMIEDHYDVRMATSGLNIQKLVQQHQPDVVLLDYEMPLFDGKQTMMKMRECPEMREVPIIFVTAVNKKEHIMQVLNLRPAGYILKPVEKERILQTIKDVIGE